MNGTTSNNAITSDWIEIVSKHVQFLKFGVVQITVHDSRVVQIEKTEKLRLDRTGPEDSH